jgi:hypothetical protein
MTNLTEEDVIQLEEKLNKLFEKLKANAYKLTQTTELIDQELVSKKYNDLELLYGQEFGFACENYELNERMLSILNDIYLFDDSRLMARRIERDMKKYVLVSLIDV